MMSVFLLPESVLYESYASFYSQGVLFLLCEIIETSSRHELGTLLSIKIILLFYSLCLSVLVFQDFFNHPPGTLREALLCEKPRCARLRSRTLREALRVRQSPIVTETAKTGAGLTALRASTWGKPPLERAAHRPQGASTPVSPKGRSLLGGWTHQGTKAQSIFKSGERN